MPRHILQINLVVVLLVLCFAPISAYAQEPESGEPTTFASLCGCFHRMDSVTYPVLFEACAGDSTYTPGIVESSISADRELGDACIQFSNLTVGRYDERGLYGILGFDDAYIIDSCDACSDTQEYTPPVVPESDRSPSESAPAPSPTAGDFQARIDDVKVPQVGCVLRSASSLSKKQLSLTGSGFSHPDIHLQFRLIPDGEESIHILAEIDWENDRKATAEWARVNDLLWPELRSAWLQVRLTRLIDGAYYPATDWSLPFAISADEAACKSLLRDRSGSDAGLNMPFSCTGTSECTPITDAQLSNRASNSVVVVFIGGINSHNSADDPALIKGFADIRAAISSNPMLRRLIPSQNYVYFSYSQQYDRPSADGGAYSMPTYGVADTLAEDYSWQLNHQMEEYRLHLDTLLGKFPNRRFVIIAHSMGGVVASYWAAMSTSRTWLDRVDLVITIDSPLQGTYWGIVGDGIGLVNPRAHIIANYLNLQALKPENEVIATAKTAGSKVPYFTIRNEQDRFVLPSEAWIEGAVIDLKANLCESTACDTWHSVDAVTGGHSAVLYHADTGKAVANALKAVLGITKSSGTNFGRAQPEAIVRVGALNVRSGPGTNYDIVDVVKAPEHLSVIGRDRQCNWIQVVTPRNITGWVSGASEYVNLNMSCTRFPLSEINIPQTIVIPRPTDPAVAQPANSGTTNIIADFEIFGTWRRGDESYGNFMQSTSDVFNGRASGQLDYNFPPVNNNYVVFLRDLPIPGDPKALEMWVKGDGSGNYLNVWVKDARGHVWQFTFGKISQTGWQKMYAALDINGTWPVGIITGDANATMSYPLRLYALVLDAVPDGQAQSGTIYLDDLASSTSAQVTTLPSHPQEPPRLTPTSTPGTSSQPQVGATPVPPVQVAASPEISFWADYNHISSNACTVLRWDVRNVREVYYGILNGSLGGVTGTGSRRECPPRTTTYVLRVILPDGREEYRTISVTVTDQPSISFYTYQATIKPGECTQLYWSVNNVREVYYGVFGYNMEGMPGEGSRTECPSETTIYGLRVIHVDGREEIPTVTITVTDGAPAVRPQTEPSPTPKIPFFCPGTAESCESEVTP